MKTLIKRFKKFNAGESVPKSIQCAILLNTMIPYLPHKKIISLDDLGQYKWAPLIEDILKYKSSFEEFREMYPNEIVNYRPTLVAYPDDSLGILYNELLGKECAKKTGSYYTPVNVCRRMIDVLLRYKEVSKDDSIIDPACGTGAFLTSLYPARFNYKLIYGQDIDPIAVNIARINMYLLYINIFPEIDTDELCNTIYSNITIGNYFDNENQYDFVIGNPPWGYKYSNEEYNDLSKKFDNLKSNPESFDLFIRHALQHSRKAVNFLVPESILNVKNYMSLRKRILEKSHLLEVELFGNRFSNVLCPCVSLLLDRAAENYDSRKFTIVQDGIKPHKMVYPLDEKDLRIDEKSFDVQITDEDYEFFRHINKVCSKFDTRYLTSENCIYALGLVTGDNKKHLKKEEEATDEYELIISGQNVDRYILRSSEKDRYIHYTTDSDYQQTAYKFYRVPEKLLYRFICKDLVVAYDNDQYIPLNSCNVIIPKFKDIDMKYIMAVLNSSVIQKFYHLKFNSIKVLRSSIEQLPIIVPHDIRYSEILKHVNTILSSESNDYIQALIDIIDNIICSIYDFSVFN